MCEFCPRSSLKVVLSVLVFLTVPQATETALPLSAPALNLHSLTIIKWRNDEGNVDRFNVISSVAYKWHDIGKILDIDYGSLEAISMKHQDPKRCCDDVFNKWLEDGSDHYPITWDGLVEILKDAGLPHESEKLKIALSRHIS